MKIFRNNILTLIKQRKVKFVDMAESANKVSNIRSYNKSFLNASLRFLKALLSLFLIIEIINFPLIILALIYSIYKNSNMQNNLMNVLFCITFIITLICITIITFELREIIKAFMDKEVFVLKNALRLRRVGFSTIIVGVFIFVNNVIKYGTGVFILLNIENGITSRIDTVLGIFIGIIILVFSEIFKEAVKIKEENDLMI
ncbi:DUF2975 domain-containing protein [Clostridium scatologenes]|uniref:DUF2975 domain-containing protein n=1 Tax=Clostridium scatologenes TaxID=1548 RepID=A0A0E3MA01_CLOSL|nr:DUF2975 domain-containing protein [Clostridium scatologenes]AKA70059.1 hypothetical protein CSCA_2934 [Clostridium scatologenes]